MASHSGYPHLHHQPSPHLPPPPQSTSSSVAQTPDLRLPSLRSLNFAYPPVGEPGSTSAAPLEGPSVPQPRADQQPRATFTPQDEYYHQREMPYYPDAASSSSHAVSTAKRARSASNSNSGAAGAGAGTRSPYGVPPHHGHAHSNSSPGTYHPHAHAHTPAHEGAQGRSATAAGGSAQGHVQGHSHPGQAQQYPHPHAHHHHQQQQQQHPQQQQQQHQQQPEPAPAPYFTRPPQPSQAWYYSSGQQPQQQQQPQQHQQPHQHQQHPNQQPPPQPHHQPQPHPQPQHQPPPPQSLAQKHPLHFPSYGPGSSNQHPHSRSSSFSAGPSQSHGTSSSSPASIVLTGPGSAPAPAPSHPTNTLNTINTTNTINTINAVPLSSASAPGFASPTAGFPPGSALGSGPGAGLGMASGIPGTGAGVRVTDSKALGEEAERAAAGGMHLSKITEHSAVLCDFANHYASLPHLRPSAAEVAEMAQRATLVLQLVEHLKRTTASAASTGGLMSPVSASAEHAERAFSGEGREGRREGAEDNMGMKSEKPRATGVMSKKRPWEDVGAPSEGGGEEQERSGEDTPSFEGKDMSALRSVAEKDMAIIRSKRGQGIAGAGASPGIVKAKYRKRSRATPPGKCHSCNIRETPEWRRGPDGARTLCNACGLHYAKLIRKRDKTIGPGGDVDAPPIDLDMLRASTRLANEQPGPKASGSALHHHSSGSDRDSGFHEGPGDMAEIQLQPVPAHRGHTGGGLAPSMGVSMQVHQWTPPSQPAAQREEGYELAAYSTSLMRSSNARGSPT